MEIKDSGQRRTFETGAVRDIAEGKGRCDIMPLFDIGNTFDDDVLRLIGLYVECGNLSNLESAVRVFVESELTENPIIFPFLIYDVLLDLSKFYEKGLIKYGEGNWTLGIPLHCYIDSGVRHYLKHMTGETDEPHDLAFLWNIFCAMWTHRNKPEMIDLPFIKRANNDSDTECRSQLDKCARELVGVIDDLCRQIDQCGLDEQMWEAYRTAKEVLGDD